jgi:ATP-dependent exoDNAse (exonuclease V) beta subunit
MEIVLNTLKSNDISLNKEDHVYILKSDPTINFTSVTTFIDTFFEKFDSHKIATKLIEKYPKYADHTIEGLKQEWKDAAQHGTNVHEEIENWIKEKIIPSEDKAKYGLRWLHEYKKKSKIEIISEVMLYSKELKISGTVDILALNNYTGKYDIIDWKTSKKITKRSFNNKMGTKSPTKNIMDCNFSHYSLQLSLYRYILERYYGLEIENQYIVHLKEDAARAILTPYLKENIIRMLNH